MVKFETERLIIREYHEADLPHILEIYNNKENMKLVSSGKYVWNEKELTEKLKRFNKDYPKGYGIYMAELKAKNRIIGEAALFNSFKDEKVLELSYIIDHQYWGMGLGKEMVQGLINYGVSTLKLTKLIARMYAKNVASSKVAEKCGMILAVTGITETNKAFKEYHIYNE